MVVVVMVGNGLVVLVLVGGWWLVLVLLLLHGGGIFKAEYLKGHFLLNFYWDFLASIGTLALS